MDNQKTMPPEIAKAIVDVMGEVKKLGKDANNKHGGYNYVSVDQFFDQVGRLMHDAGIFVIVNETDCETATRETTDSYGKMKVSAWLTSHYDIFIYHASGAEYGPIKRTIQVSATGPQSYGSAISYVEKYFLRSLFKIPTGEQDADADAQEGLPPNQKRHPPKPPSIASNLYDQDTSQITRDALIEAIDMAINEGDLRAWSSANAGVIARLMEADRQAVRDAYSDKMQSLKNKEAA